MAHGSIRHDLTAAYFWAIVRRSQSAQLVPFGGVAGLKSSHRNDGGPGRKVERDPLRNEEMMVMDTRDTTTLMTVPTTGVW